MEAADDLKITVKRRTWYIGSSTPVKIQFNGRLIGTVDSFEETEMNILAKKGQLVCTSPMERESKLSVQAGDRVLIKDTLFNRIANILLIVFTLILIINFTYGLLLNTNTGGLIPMSRLTVIGVYLFISVGIYFSRGYRIVIDN